MKAILIFRQLDRRNISIQYVTVVYVSPQYFSWAQARLRHWRCGLSGGHLEGLLK